MAEQANTAEAWEAEERRRELETEAWKVAQLAATMMAGMLADPGVTRVENEWIVPRAADLLAEARLHVATNGTAR